MRACAVDEAECYEIRSAIDSVQRALAAVDHAPRDAKNTARHILFVLCAMTHPLLSFYVRQQRRSKDARPDHIALSVHV